MIMLVCIRLKGFVCASFTIEDDGHPMSWIFALAPYYCSPCTTTYDDGLATSCSTWIGWRDETCFHVEKNIDQRHLEGIGRLRLCSTWIRWRDEGRTRTRHHDH
jgi:hypothetical protein